MQFFEWFTTLLGFYRLLGVKVGSFVTFHVPVVGSYFLTWYGLASKALSSLSSYPSKWFFIFFYFIFDPLPPNNLSLNFDIRSFECLPFGPSLTAIVHTYPFQLCSHVATSLIPNFFPLFVIFMAFKFL
jgi:hypothetical protein